MKKHIGLLMVMVGALLWLAMPGNTSALAQKVQLSGEDRHFLEEAGTGGMMEVKLGQLALTQSTNDEVKSFAQRMITDHSKANDELKRIASKYGVSFPADLEREQKGMYEHLSELRGADFDREYMRHMLEDHIRDVQSFQNQAKKGENPDLKAFAANRVNTLEQHLKMAKDVHGDVERKASA